MRLTVHTTLESLQQLAPEWNTLLHQSYSDRIFSTYEWQETWWASYSPGELLVIAIHDEAGQLIGIAPWFIEVRTDERVLRSIGCVDVTDYVDLIVHRDHIESVHRALADYLAQNALAFDRINLCNIPDASQSLTTFVAALQHCGFQVATEIQEVCPIIKLPETFDQYLESLEKKQRHELRRKLRRAEGDVETVDWYIVGPEHNLDEELARFTHLMAASQPAKAEFLSNTRNAAFMQHMAHQANARGWLQLSFLRVDGEACASYMNFDYGEGIQVYNSGLLPEKYGHLSPGIVLLAHNIRHAIDTHHKTFDFLRGNEVYKYRLGALDTRVHMLKARFSG